MNSSKTKMPKEKPKAKRPKSEIKVTQLPKDLFMYGIEARIIRLEEESKELEDSIEEMESKTEELVTRLRQYETKYKRRNSRNK